MPVTRDAAYRNVDSIKKAETEEDSPAERTELDHESCSPSRVPTVAE